ncbi:MAG: ABC transporter ATP-binding protein/permease [Spirochaetia bacterium]|nr:ABC transporter ATP-binding protein/permease [Spirochaetia bacterium]MCE1210267.1 ABC transporter ATP-binding protein/permease [Spirochaetia bacterium]
MLKILKYYKPYIGNILLVFLLLFIQANAELALPDYMSKIVDIGIMRGGEGQGQTAYILKMGGIMLALTLLAVAATIAVGYFGSRTASGVARDLRRAIFSKVQDFSSAEMDKFSTASLITRSTNDITQIQMVSNMAMRMLFFAPIIGIGGIIRATSKASSMWWIIALAVGILLAIVLAVFSIALPKFKRIQALVDRLNLVLRENLTGMMVIRAFATEKKEEQRFGEVNAELTGIMLFVSRIMALMMPLITLIMNGIAILIVWVGAKEIAQSQIQIGDMMAFMQYSMQIFFSFMMMSMMFIIIPRASISADRIQQVLTTGTSVVDPPLPAVFPDKLGGVVRFDNVSFRYPGSNEDVLHRIDFTARPGKVTAVVGTTGAGKTTLVSLVPRFYDVTEGAVSIDGVDVRSVKQKALRDLIGFVPQKASLFSGTVESNLRYARDEADSEDLDRALEIAQAKEFVRALPGGISAPVSQGGMNFSGGQRQRLTIARALMKKGPVFIFDDSFSALDFTTDKKLRAALTEKLADSTVILVTQRVATIKEADQIIVLDEGKMVGKGRHAELMETCEVYRDIALSQLSAEELV